MAEISERILRPFLKDRYDELEQEIEIEMAQFSYELARSLKLPVETARELAESLSLVPIPGKRSSRLVKTVP
jgi:hypothetical protein